MLVSAFSFFGLQFRAVTYSRLRTRLEIAAAAGGGGAAAAAAAGHIDGKVKPRP